MSGLDKCSLFFFNGVLNGTLFSLGLPAQVHFFSRCMCERILKLTTNCLSGTEILMASINKNKSKVYPLEHISRIFLDFSMPSSGRAEEDFIASTVFQYLPSHVPKLSIEPPCFSFVF